jgi:hypothetical protein
MDEAWRKVIWPHHIVKRSFFGVQPMGGTVLETAPPCHYLMNCAIACSIETIGQVETPTMMAKNSTSAT